MVKDNLFHPLSHPSPVWKMWNMVFSLILHHYQLNISKLQYCDRCEACLWTFFVESGLFLQPINLIPYCRHKNTHQGADIVEEAIREIDKGRYAQYGRLSHTTTIPRDEWWSYGYRIFNRTSQQTGIISIFLINILKHIARQDDGDILNRNWKVPPKHPLPQQSG